MAKDTTHFGYQSIPIGEKIGKVASVFHSVASRYDLMNDLMSFGLHRLWKRLAIAKCALKPHHVVLDLAGGTGDLTRIIAKKLNHTGSVTLADINASMLSKGRESLLNAGIVSPVNFTQANAEMLPFTNNSFNCITMAFGLRNVTTKEYALKEMFRVLKPGGRVVILEFSEVTSDNFKKLYDTYSFAVLPKLGKWICQDEESYRYLAESIRMHPNQETLKLMMQDAGFMQCEYQNLQAGIVAVHLGFKF